MTIFFGIIYMIAKKKYIQPDMPFYHGLSESTLDKWRMNFQHLSRTLVPGKLFWKFTCHAGE